MCHLRQVFLTVFGDLGDLEEVVRRALHDYFEREGKVSEDIGAMLPSSFDAREPDKLAGLEIASTSPESSQC